MLGWLGFRTVWLGLRHGWMAQRGGRTDGGADGQTNVRKIYPFYRTSSPIWAAALLPPMKTKEVEQGKGTADHLMPFAYLLEVFQIRARHFLIAKAKIVLRKLTLDSQRHLYDAICSKFASFVLK